MDFEDKLKHFPLREPTDRLDARIRELGRGAGQVDARVETGPVPVVLCLQLGYLPFQCDQWPLKLEFVGSVVGVQCSHAH